MFKIWLLLITGILLTGCCRPRPYQQPYIIAEIEVKTEEMASITPMTESARLGTPELVPLSSPIVP